MSNINVTSGNYVTKNYYNQLVNAGEELTFTNDNGTGVSKWALDYVILRNIPSSVSVTVSDAGMERLFSRKRRIPEGNRFSGIYSLSAQGLYRGRVYAL